MRNVKRLPEPDTLRRRGARWTRELLEQVEEKRRNRRHKIEAKYFDRYNRGDVKNTVIRMYKGLCCYCESRILDVDFGHIEHRMPKRVYPEDTYQWENLHLACTKCNNAKGDKYDEKYPILDATDEVPISEHLTYKIRNVGVVCWPLDGWGKTTEEHADLNREELSDVRNKLMMCALSLIAEIKECGSSHIVDVIMKELDVLCQGEHGSLFEYLKNTMLS